jgi:hypothetical protein
VSSQLHALSAVAPGKGSRCAQNRWLRGSERRCGYFGEEEKFIGDFRESRVVTLANEVLQLFDTVAWGQQVEGTIPAGAILCDNTCTLSLKDVTEVLSPRGDG